jgi:hypothetical protein
MQKIKSDEKKGKKRKEKIKILEKMGNYKYINPGGKVIGRVNEL